MPVEFVDFEEARKRDGLRMVVVSGVPSPWGEAAKGILYVKQIPWLADTIQSVDRSADLRLGTKAIPARCVTGIAFSQVL